MFLLKTSLFNPIDLLAFPLVLMLLYLVNKVLLRNEDHETKRFFIQALWIRVLMLLVFTVLMQFYYGGGDSFRYYVSVLDIRMAINSNALSVWDLFTTEKIDSYHPLYNFFATDELRDNHYYMMTTANFAVPKIATFFSFLFFNSYLAIGFCFSYFALLGALQIYKVITVYFEHIKGHVALACFFIPTVCFWSSGLLKDSLTFGALGFLFGAVYNLFIARRRILTSVLAAAMSFYLLYMIKPYIMLAFAPALLLLLTTLWSTQVPSPQLKRLMFFFMALFGVLGGFFLYQNLTSEGALQRYNSEIILDALDKQRSLYNVSAAQEQAGSSFNLGSDNQLFLFPLGIIASYFRPFLWEIRNPVMALSALESLVCTLLVIFVFVKVGFIRTFRIIFSNPLALFCFIFSLLFGGAVGTSTGNFGSLVRYKIPGLPFFILLFLIVLHLAKVPLPARLRRFKLLQGN